MDKGEHGRMGATLGRAPGGEGTEPRLIADLLEAGASAMGAAVLALTSEGVLLWHNERFAAMCGIPGAVLEQGSRSALVEWLAASSNDGAAELARQLAAPRGSESGEFTTGGRVIAWQVVGVGGDRGHVWAFHDVTAARQAALALRDAGNLLRLIEAHADGVVLELDSEARIVGVWATSAAFFEEPDAMLQGRSVADVIRGEQGATFAALVQKVFGTGRSETFEYAVDLRGESRVFSAHALLMPSVEDEPPRVTAMIRDSTERIRAQTQTLEAERIISAGLLAAGVAHEINNPLAYTLLNLERIQRGLSELVGRQASEDLIELEDAARMSLQGGRRVQTIVRDLERFSRSDHAEIRRPVDVRRVLDFAIDMASPETQGRARLVREFGHVPYVMASETRLSQIFLNLIVNAAQAFTGDPSDQNEIRVVTTTDDRGRAIVEVRDTGGGMPPSVKRHVFEPFYTTKGPGAGTGLGLAICQRIATSLGGRLAVESEVGRGSVFRLLLPAADED
jgi:two-component system, NtrC family, sensor kinase